MLKAELEELVEQQAARIAELEALPHHEITTVQDASPAIAVIGYLVFAGDASPEGGWRDYRQCFANEADAVARARDALANGCAWAEVVDLPTGRVQEFGRDE